MESYFAKQPILSTGDVTYGYELLYRNTPEVNSFNGADGDVTTADVLNNVFFGGNPLQLLDGKKAFVNFTENLLLEGIAKLLPKDILVVEILETVSPSQKILDCCQELKCMGYTIALDDYVYSEETSMLFPFADIVKIDFRESRDKIENTAKYCRMQNKTILAEKVETYAEVEYAKSLGCTLMQGYYFARPQIISNVNQSPQEYTFMRLISLLDEPEPDMDKLESVISIDVPMSIKLIKLVNSIRSDTTQKISNIKQALVMLGVKKLNQWIFLVGLQQLSKDRPEELVRMSVCRGKFCELMADIIPAAKPYKKELYLMGMLSVAVSSHIISVSLDELPVSENIKDGINGVEGIFSEILIFSKAFERGEWEIVDSFVAKYNIDEVRLSRMYIECTKELHFMD